MPACRPARGWTSRCARARSPAPPTNAPPTVAITSPLSGENFQFPAAAIPVTANAQDSDGTVTQVEFFANGDLIGGATASPYTIQWSNVQVGDYTLTARATDNLGAQTTSAAVNVTVRLPQVFYMHTDHLNTPRLIANQVGQAVWQWNNDDPFGANVPNENPSGLGAFTCNLRLPGQYFDKETNLHYNYFRDYDPAIGRYVQSDPIGLAGGINTCLYVLANPLSLIDSFGLQAPTIPRPAPPPGLPGSSTTPRPTPGDEAVPGGRDRPSERPSRPGSGCRFIREVYYGGPCKTCWYECPGYGAPVTYPQAVEKPCPGIRPDGLVDTDAIDPKCRGTQPTSSNSGSTSLQCR